MARGARKNPALYRAQMACRKVWVPEYECVRDYHPIPFCTFPSNHSSIVMHYDPSQVYQPEADTHLLLVAAVAELKPGDRVAEAGTGSGLIAAAVGNAATTIATEISPHAAACARMAGVEVVRCNLLDAVRGPFDLILFNPPYLPTEPHERIDDWLEYALDGGANGRETIARFAAGVGRVLAPGGRILLLISSLTGFDGVKEIFTGYGYSAEVVRQEKVEDEVLYVLRIRR